MRRKGGLKEEREMLLPLSFLLLLLHFEPRIPGVSSAMSRRPPPAVDVESKLV